MCIFTMKVINQVVKLCDNFASLEIKGPRQSKKNHKMLKAIPTSQRNRWGGGGGGGGPHMISHDSTTFTMTLLPFTEVCNPSMCNVSQQKK